MSKIVSIHSFRGGTGKSNVVANIASLIALEGKRVAIIDTDIQSPGIHVLFGFDESKMDKTLNDYLYGRCTIDEVAVNIGQHVGEDPGRQKLQGTNLWLIPSSMNSGEISNILKNGYDVNLLIKGLKQLGNALNLDYIFIDTHPGLNEETLLSIVISDVLLIILRPDQQDFQGTAVTVDIARSLDVANLRLLINKALVVYEGDQIPEQSFELYYNPEQMRQQVEDTYGARVTGVLPLTVDMVGLGSSDIFALRFPEHSWSQVIKGVAEDILNS